VSAVLGELWRDDRLPENVAAKVRIPKSAKVDRRELTALKDGELVRYVAWEHPEVKKRMAVLERQAMACLSRVFGGVRWDDVRSLRWENFVTAGGSFAKGWAPRKKTARPQPLEVPSVLPPILKDWWARHGRPAEGLIFPARRGEGAGEERKAGSMARALRRDLQRAFGIVVQLPAPWSGRTIAQTAAPRGSKRGR
jgi:integrase